MGKIGDQENLRPQDPLENVEDSGFREDQHNTSIAKALVHNSSILVVNEKENIKNLETEFEVEELILNMREMSVLSVSRQMSKSLMEKYDKIFVLDQKSQVKEGTFQKIFQHNPYFYHLNISNET